MRILFSVLLGIFCCLLIAALVGENPVHVFNVLLSGAAGSLSNFGYTLFYTTPLIFTGLSVAVAFHCGLFNIGAEGQLYMGALALTSMGLAFPHLPFAPLFAIMAAFLGGGLWGALAGFLKAYRGSHEVIATIMLNFISYALCGFTIMHIIRNPLSQNPESAVLTKNFFIPGVGSLSENAPVNSALLLALATAFLVWILLFKTQWGFEVRLLGSSPQTAMRVGINIRHRLVQAMAVSGGLAGLVAVNEVLGFAHKFRDQFSAGYGFMGIAVALLGRNKPLGIIFAALLFGALQKGALDLELDTEKITRDLAGVMQALIILFVASEGLWRGRFFKKVKA